MRRTMHAVAILLACATQLQAQSPSDKNTASAQRSTLVRSENAAEYAETNEVAATPAATSPSSGPQFMRPDSGRAYSPLGSYLQCSDWRPNLWDGYQCERAAVVARISQHIDMTCKCFQCKNNLYSQACEPCASGCGGDCSGLACKLGAVKKVRNRYREPMSTLCGSASDACGVTCGSPCGQTVSGSCESSSGCASGSCGSVSAQQPSADAVHAATASATKTMPAVSNATPRDRVATPVISNPRAASNGANRSSLFEMHR